MNIVDSVKQGAIIHGVIETVNQYYAGAITYSQFLRAVTQVVPPPVDDVVADSQYRCLFAGLQTALDIEELERSKDEINSRIDKMSIEIREAIRGEERAEAEEGEGGATTGEASNDSHRTGEGVGAATEGQTREAGSENAAVHYKWDGISDR